MSTNGRKSTLAVTLRPSEGALSIAYTFTHQEGASVALFNRLAVVAADGQSSRIDPGAAYVEVEGTTLHVRKMVLAIPTGLRASERLVPYLSRVEAGATFEETLSFALPVKADQPYRLAWLQGQAPDGHRVSASRAVTVTAVTFSLGVVVIGAGERLIEVEPGVFRVWPPGPAVDRQVVLTETVDVSEHPIDALDYA